MLDHATTRRLPVVLTVLAALLVSLATAVPATATTAVNEPVVASRASWSATTVDVEQQSAAVTVTVQLPATVEGRAPLPLDVARLRSARSTQVATDSSPVIAAGDGPTSVFTFLIPRHAAEGEWRLELPNVLVPYVGYHPVALPPDVAPGITVRSPLEDIEPPMVVGLSVDSQSVNTRYHERQVEWSLRVDDRSAVRSVDAVVERPDSEYGWAVTLHAQADGSFVHRMGVGPHNAVGTYRLRLTEATDILGNVVTAPEVPATATTSVTLFHADDVPAAPQVSGSYADARGSLVARWIAPTTDGGSPVTGYEVTLLPERRRVDVAPDTLTATFTGLGDDEPHEFEVVARNAIGPSAPSVSVGTTVRTWGVPGAPTQPTATARRTVVDLSWRRPSNGPVDGFVVTATPGGTTITVPWNPLSTTTTARFPGLSAGVDYTFTVAARNVVGQGPDSAPSSPVHLTPEPTAPVIAGSLGPNGVANVRWNRPLGYDDLELYEACQHRSDGTVVTCNLTRYGDTSFTDGRAGRAFGYTVRARGELGFGPRSATLTMSNPEGTGHGYVAVAPRRMLDTRTGVGAPARPVTAGETVVVTVPDLPVGARSVTLNLTGTGAALPTYVTAHATGTARPNASHLNIAPGQTVASLVTVPASADGRISLYSQGRTHLIADVAGYTMPSGGSVLLPQAGQRIVDTRSGIGWSAGPLAAGGAVTFTVAPPTGQQRATAAVVNITATGATGTSHLTAYPADLTRPPTASNLNITAGATVANLAVVRLDDSGRAILRNASASVHVIVDVVGVYTEDLGVGFTAVAPTRAMDTRSGLGASGKVGATPVSLTLTDVPAGAKAVLLRTTAVSPSRTGYLMAHPSTSLTTSSTLNFVANQTVGNVTVVPIGPDAVVRFSASSGTETHLLVDVAGYHVR